MLLYQDCYIALRRFSAFEAQPLEGFQYLSLCCLDFLFVLLTHLSLWVVSKKTPWFLFLLNSWQLQSASFLRISHESSRGSWLAANEVRNEKDVTPNAGHSHWVPPGQTLDNTYMVLCDYEVCVYKVKLFL